MKTVNFLGHQIPLENMRVQYIANTKGLKKMVERSLKTGKYNGFTTAQLIEKAEQYEQIALNLK